MSGVMRRGRSEIPRSPSARRHSAVIHDFGDCGRSPGGNDERLLSGTGGNFFGTDCLHRALILCGENRSQATAHFFYKSDYCGIGGMGDLEGVSIPKDKQTRASKRILEPDRNCWRMEQAQRATPLVDGCYYFRAVRAAMLNARRKVFIIGWDIDGRISLPKIDDDDDAPESLRDLIVHVARRRPELQIYVLLWDYTVLYAGDRQPFVRVVFDWATPKNVKLVLDDEIPIGGAHHQKIVAVDDRLAFVGGIDLTSGRWDTRDHSADDPRRIDHEGKPYGPFHDSQLVVDGEAAGAVADHCRWRWRECTGERIKPVQNSPDPWPKDLETAWCDVKVGIARTLPERNHRPEIREILQLYLDAIAAAESSIYIENQYLAADPIADALAKRLEEKDGPEVVIVTQSAASAWLEEQVMGIRRSHFVGRLRKSDDCDRLRILVPTVPGVSGDSYTLHAKVCIIDDRLVQIGSANINNRSMGYDSECDLAIECIDEAERATAREFRDGLLAEHLGLDTATVQSEIDRRGSLIAAIEALGTQDGRRLSELEVSEEPLEPVSAIVALGDPERPIDISGWVRESLSQPDDQSEGSLVRRVMVAVAVLLGLIALAAVWRLTPLSAFLDPENLAETLEGARQSSWGGLAVIGIFVVGGFLVFPVTVMILGTAIVFGPWSGFAYAALGALISASVTYGAGWAIGKRFLRRLVGERVREVSRRLGDKGVVAVTALRIIPTAPFTIINFVAGASHIRFLDYLVGTVLGMVPGIAILALTGERIEQVFRNPTFLNVSIAVLFVGLWFLLGWGLQHVVNRVRGGAE